MEPRVNTTKHKSAVPAPIDLNKFFDADDVARIVDSSKLDTVSSDSTAYGLAMVLDKDFNVIKRMERGDPPRPLGGDELALIATNEILRIHFSSGVPNSDNKRAVGIKLGRLTEKDGGKENTIRLRATIEFQIDRHNRIVGDEIYALMKERNTKRLTKKALLSALGNDLKEGIQDFLQTAINKKGSGNLGMGSLRTFGMEELSPIMHDQGLVFKRIACNIDKRSKWGRLIVPNRDYDPNWVTAVKVISYIAGATGATASILAAFGISILPSPQPTVTIGSHANGSVVIERNDCTSSSECEVELGSDLTLNISADEGYKLVDLSCSGECPSGLELGTSVRVQNIGGDFTITPKFRDTRTLRVDNRNAAMGNATCTVVSDGQSGSECAEVPGGTIRLEAAGTPMDSDGDFIHVFERWQCPSDSWCGGVDLRQPSMDITVPESSEPLLITPVFRRDRLVTLRIRPSSPSEADIAIAVLEDGCIMSDGCTHSRDGSTEVYTFQLREGVPSPRLTIAAPAPSDSNSIYRFAEWQCDVGQCPGGGSTAPLTLSANVTIKAAYTMRVVLVATDIDWSATEFPAGDCTTEGATLRCVFDESIDVTISPRSLPDRRHIGWTCSGSACDGQAFIDRTSISGSFDSSAMLTPVYEDIVLANLTIGRGANGSATADCGSNCRREAGWKVTVTATPDSGYEWVSWDCTGSCPSGNPSSSVRLTINQDTHITPVFREVTFATLTIGSGVNGGSATTDCGSDCRHEPGWEVTVTARPDSGYTWEGWECSGSCPSGNPSSSVRLTINQDTHITPVFSESPFATLTIGSGANGSATADCGSNCMREPGWDVTVTARPDSGYEWVGWNCSGSCPSGNPSSSVRLTINRDTRITPIFRFREAPPVGPTEVTTVTLTVKVGEGGQLNRNLDDGITSSCEGPGTCSYEIESGQRIHVDADPDIGYEPGQWRRISGDSFSEASDFDIDITLTQDTELEVTFVKEPPFTSKSFRLTSTHYPHNGDWDAAVKSEISTEYRVADWDDLKAFHDNGGDLVGTLEFAGLVKCDCDTIDDANDAAVTRDGFQNFQREDGTPGRYYITWYTSSVPSQIPVRDSIRLADGSLLVLAINFYLTLVPPQWGILAVPVNFSPLRDITEVSFAMLTIGSGANGSATADCGSDCRHEAGWEVTVTAVPDSGYRWEGWDCTGSCPSGNPSSSVRLTISQDTHITPVFRKVTVSTVTLTVRVGEGGHLVQRSDDGITSSCEGPRTCSYEIERGQSIHVDADAEDGYEPGQWRSISGNSFSDVLGDIDITLTQDTELEVTFPLTTGFRLTSEQYFPHNYKDATGRRFDSTKYRFADWDELKAVHAAGGDLVRTLEFAGLVKCADDSCDNAPYTAIVVRDGTISTEYGIYYFISWFISQIPSDFDTHDDTTHDLIRLADGSILALGSRSNLYARILAVPSEWMLNLE